jgi:hypothetical protein
MGTRGFEVRRIGGLRTGALASVERVRNMFDEMCERGN